MVEGFNGIPKYPIIPAVNNMGIKLGIKLTMTILQLINSKAIIMEMATIAILSERMRLLIK
jgi:hypothetical protein